MGLRVLVRFLALPAVALAPVRAQEHAAIVVRVDRRVELTSIVFRLAGSPEYSQARLQGYASAVDAWFGKHEDHAVVRRARQLRATRGVSFDAVASFAVHLDRDDPLGEQGFDPLPARLDRRWTSADAAAFHADLRAFAKASKADEFFARHEDFYAAAEAAMRATLAEHADLSWFDRFFGARPGARFQVALGLLNGGANYGPSVQTKDGEDLYCVLGCWQSDPDGKPVFGRPVVGTVVHEFCHSYCNPLVDRHLPELLAAGEKLFSLTEAAMREQAYGNARTVLCESLVRACTVRYVAASGDARAVAAAVAEEHARSFLWVGELAKVLERYEAARDRYPTLEEFAPDLVGFFRDAAADTEAALARRPKVVTMTPANGATDVDPATQAIVITFDRPMRDRSWAVVGGGEHFPKLGSLSYDAERKVLTIPVELKPDWEYEFWLNRGRYDAFRSAEGEALAPVRVRFRTRGQ